MDLTGIRNLKDFMLFYNVTTETCFQHCVDNFNSRSLHDDELKCAEVCAGKYINYLNKVLSSYISAQQELTTKRMAEMQQVELAQQAQMSTPTEEPK